jgi:glutaredoxin 3
VSQIEIYTQAWCPYCSLAMRILDGKGATYREINAPHGTPERLEAVRRSGGRTTVPQIFIDDRPIGGCDDLQAWDASGELDRLLALSK